MKTRRFLIAMVAIPVYCTFTLFVAPLSSWLLINAQTWSGRGLALVGLSAVLLLGSFLIIENNQSWRHIRQILSIMAVGLLLLIILTSPSGRARHHSPVSNQFTTQTHFPRYSPTNVIPEIEQVNLAFTLIPYLDPLLTHQQSREVREYTLDIYREMEKDSDFHRLGSVMGWAYADLAGIRYDVGHYFFYVPRNRPEGALPAIVFLHGSAGNFKAYVWVWSQIAEQHGMVLIVPSYGFGDWTRPTGSEAVIHALDDAMAIGEVEIDPDQVYLAGISNGGLGVSGVGEQYARRFQGLIFISPVYETSSIESPLFRTAWRDRSVLVLTGQADKRVSVSYVDEHVALMEASGIDVTYITYPNEDHFVFFALRDQVLSDISDWLSSTR